MADWTRIKDILPDLLLHCRIEINDDKRAKELLVEVGQDPSEYNRKVVEKQITEALRSTVIRLKRKSGDPNGQKN